MSSESLTFTVKDPLGRVIVATSESEQHILSEHLEIKREPLILTVSEPHQIWSSRTDPKSDVYFRLGADSIFSDLYYKVVVRFDVPGSGAVVTAFVTDQIRGVGGLRYVNIHK